MVRYKYGNTEGRRLENIKRGAVITLIGRVKSVNFGHHVNSGIHLQTLEIQMRRLIRIFTVCLVNLFLLFL